jgi:hypothetical protein
MKFTPQKATETIKELNAEVKKVGGTFMPLWHNTSFSEDGDWQGWLDVYIRMVEEGMKKEL